MNNDTNFVFNGDQYAGFEQTNFTTSVNTTSIVSSNTHFINEPSVTSYHMHNQYPVNSYLQQRPPPDVNYQQHQLSSTVSGHLHQPPIIENNTIPAAAVTCNYNNVVDVYAHDPYISHKSDQFSEYIYTPEIQSTEPLLSQRQDKTQQTVARNGTQETIDHKRQRSIYSGTQIIHLERSFAKNRYSDRAMRVLLAQKLKLTERQVKVWFQNKRMKEKHIKKKMGRSSAGSTSTVGSTAVDAVDGLPPSVVGHQRQHQQAEHLRPGPSATVHHYPSHADVAGGLSPVPVRPHSAASLRRQQPARSAQLPTYEQAINRRAHYWAGAVPAAPPPPRVPSAVTPAVTPAAGHPFGIASDPIVVPSSGTVHVPICNNRPCFQHPAFVSE